MWLYKLDQFGQISEKFFDYVFTVCGNANENCPYFPGEAIIHHVGFDDPPKKANGLSDEEEIQNEYRKVRDEIKLFCDQINLSFHGKK